MASGAAAASQWRGVEVGYWDQRALGEVVRLTLALHGVPFRDVRLGVGPPPRYDKAAWAERRAALGGELPLPNLPYLRVESEGVALAQTAAICRFVAASAVPVPPTAREAALADEAFGAALDLLHALFDVTYCDAPWVKGADQACHAEGLEQCERHTPKFDAALEAHAAPGGLLETSLARFDALLAKRGGAFVAGGADATYADAALYEALDEHLVLLPTCLDGFEQLAAFHRRFADLPRVKAYLAGPVFKAEPLHNRYSHAHCGWLSS